MSWLEVMRPVSDWDTSWRETKELAYWNDRGALKMAINRGVVKEAVGDIVFFLKNRGLMKK